MQGPRRKRSSSTDARAAIEGCAVSNARLTARRLTQFLTDRMKASELSVAQFGLMAQIAAASDDSLGALAERRASIRRRCRAICRCWSAKGWSRWRPTKATRAAGPSG